MAQTYNQLTATSMNNYVEKTTTYPATMADDTINCTSGTFTVTLPTAVNCGGKIFTVKNSGTGTITIATTGGQTIDGASTVILANQNESARVVSTGANWVVSGTYKVPPAPHATYSSMIIQSGSSSTTAYPVVFEYADDEDGVYQPTSTVTMTIANPTVVSWTGHGLTAGAAVIFTTDGALPTGINAFVASDSTTTNSNVVFYVIATDLGPDSFKISASIGGAALETTGTQSGTHTCRCISRFYVPENGHYLVQISGLVDTTNAAAATCDLWFDVNGSNLARSNTVAAVDSVGIQAVVAVPIVMELTAGQYVRLFSRYSASTVRLLAIAAAASPTRPQCPSMIVTVQKVAR